MCQTSFQLLYFILSFVGGTSFYRFPIYISLFLLLILQLELLVNSLCSFFFWFFVFYEFPQLFTHSSPQTKVRSSIRMDTCFKGDTLSSISSYTLIVHFTYVRQVDQISVVRPWPRHTPFIFVCVFSQYAHAFLLGSPPPKISSQSIT